MAYDVLVGDARTLADRLNGAKTLGPFSAQGLPLGTLTLIFSDPVATVTFDGSAGALVTALAAAADIEASFPSAVLELRRSNDQLYIVIWHGDGYTIDKDGTANALLGLSTTEDTVSEGAVDVTRIRGFSQGSTSGHYSMILSDQPGSADPDIGDVDGPAGATNNAIARFDGTTGKAIKNSPVTIADTGRVSGLADPSAAQDAATKAYVDLVKQGLDPKDSVRAVATTNVALTGAYTVDGVTLVNGDRYLAAAQSTGSQNGIYVYNSAGAHARATDADTSAKVTAGMFVPVTEGTTYADTTWILTTNDPITLGSTALVFLQGGIATSSAPADVTKAAAAVGTATTLARADHKHDVTTAAPVAVGSANAEGSASSLARSDHVHDASALARKRLVPNEQTGATYSIVQGDEDTSVDGNRATAQSFTADQLAAGTIISVTQKGAGQITIVAGSGVTLRAPYGAKTAAQYAAVVLHWHSATEVYVSGQAAV